MICEKCGTENKEGTTYCKKCGEDLISEEVSVNDEVASDKEEISSGGVATAVKERQERVRTSPLAVRMQEKSLKEDKKIRKKLKRTRVWVALAIIFAVLFIAENAYMIGNRIGIFEISENVAKVEQAAVEPVQEVPEFTTLSSEALEGKWKYTYSLKKNRDTDENGDYETVTEIINSEGKAALIDEGENHMSAIIIPGKMMVDGAEQTIGDTPEAFSAWYENDFVCIQMKGTEQKFIAPGGGEALVVKIPVAMDGNGKISGGIYTYTYDRVVTDLRMRYEIAITLEKE